ncbi:HET-domain-containing protein [Staphylotrichum tortipilum]|uniref:HET-domain-containing protein n=1 Tax=Staphylotrichum tortipilum TaxID=2831512 RepID=A0AAN6MK59_9PEZI|nr:HET-domain-containing protein [Staphylotrichum longicolle]
MASPSGSPASLYDFEALDTHSCSHCQKVIFNHDWDRDMWKRENESINIHLQATLGDILEGAGKSCQFAIRLARACPDLPRDARSAGLELCARARANQRDSQIPDTIERFGFWNSKARKMEIVCKEGVDSKFSYCTSENDAAAIDVLTRPIPYMPLNPASTQLVRRWLDECLRSHPECNVFRSPRIRPTRLIQILSRDPRDQSWKLRLTADTTNAGPYAALSYCWGPGGTAGQMTTTKNTIASWSQDLPWDEAPQTIHDAVRVTQLLGLNFLWIDALCIIQDDPSDKQAELPKMAAIYGDADITIVAARASRVQQGFLQNRRSTIPCSFTLPFRSTTGATGTVILTNPEGVYSEEPIDTRAWTLQERLLARRTLEFGSRQTRFSCQRDIDGHADGWTQHTEYSCGRVPRLPDLAKGHVGNEHPLRAWDSMVWSYTTRSISFAADRVHAIAALAEKFAEWIGGEYLAGLWGGGLPGNLLWSPDEDVVERPVQDQVPSWSWTAVGGEVQPNFHVPGGSQPVASGFEILESVVKPRFPGARFGALDGASLCVQGRVKAVEWKRSVTQGRYRRPADRLRVPGAGAGGFLALRAYSDAVERDGLGEDWSLIHLLLVLQRDESKSKQQPVKHGVPNAVYSGLMLKEVGPKVYSRLGIFYFVPVHDAIFEAVHPQTETEWRARFPFQASWFEGCVVATITLV